jgi:molecular chaperone DnaK
MKQRFLVGIDLGTSYSALSCLDQDFEARPVTNKEGEIKTPSVVYFAKEGAGLIVGTNALAPGYNNPERFVAQAKRCMGERSVFWEIDGVFYSPVDISAYILGKLIRDAEKELGPIERAVITVPAHFNDIQRKMTKRAGEQAGLKAVHLLNEPVAAALCFALGMGGKEMLYLRRACTVLIYDLGGGTFDLSLVRFDQTQLRVLATAGHLRLGGLDWDQRLLDQFVRSFKIMHGTDLADPKHHRSLRRLSREIESAKRRLSDTEIAETEVFFQHAGYETEYRVNRREFEQETADLVERTRALAEELIKSAGVSWREVDAVIPVGGSTRMPMIQRLIERFSGRGPRICPLSPDLAVSMGAALYAGMTQRGRLESFEHPQAKALAGYSTTAVSPRTLGLLVSDPKGKRVVQPLIPRNTSLPVVARLAVTTSHRGQSTASLKIVETEPGREGHSLLCVCRIRDLPPDLPAGSILDVELTYDAQGLLQLNARHRDSGLLATITAQYEVGVRNGSGELAAGVGGPQSRNGSAGGDD